MKIITTVFCLAALPAVIVAQQAAPLQSSPSPNKSILSSISISVPGLNCTTPAGTGNFAVQSYSWGASNPVTFGGTGSSAGKVSISSLNVTKAADACSPVLFDSVARGAFFKLLTLTQRNTDGEAISVVALENVLVESWQVSGSTGQAGATESVSFAAQKFCVTDVPSGNKFCYDIAIQKVF
jgi:type VI protein secretion system component Hcp